MRMMTKLYANGHDNVRPNSIGFSLVFDAYSKVASEDAAVACERVEELLDLMETTGISSEENLTPCYNAAANAFAKSASKDAVDKALALMERMRNNSDAVPDVITYTSCVEACARAGTDESLIRGKELLNEMVDHPELRPNSFAFNTLLDTVVKGTSKDRFRHADELIQMMKRLGADARPDLTTYSIMIGACSKSGESGAERRAVDYLRDMLQSYRVDGNKHAKPDSFVFNCCISMLSRSRESWTLHSIHQTLMAMQREHDNGNARVIPDTITYNLVIKALSKAKTKKSIAQAEKLLQSMKDSTKAGNNAMAPDIITYTSIVNAVDPPRAAEIATSLLNAVMESRTDVVIDEYGLRCLLLALAKRGGIDAARTARKSWLWFEGKQEETTKDVLSSRACDLVVLAQTKANDRNGSAVGSHSFLMERIKLFVDCDDRAILPTVVGFSATLGALASANRLDDAFLLLEKMKELSSDGVPDLKIDSGCYISVLGSLGRNGSPDSALHTNRVLKHAIAELESMDTRLSNAALGACASTTGTPENRRKALDVAFQVFHHQKQQADAVTYGAMVKACMTLIDDDGDRKRLLKPIFKMAAKSGLVGNMVWRELRHLRNDVAGHDRLEMLPKEWTCNANDR